MTTTAFKAREGYESDDRDGVESDSNGSQSEDIVGSESDGSGGNDGADTVGGSVVSDYIPHPRQC